MKKARCNRMLVNQRGAAWVAEKKATDADLLVEMEKRFSKAEDDAKKAQKIVQFNFRKCEEEIVSETSSGIRTIERLMTFA